MGHGSGHGSAPGSAHASFPFDDDEDNSPAKEVSPVKPKKPSKRAAKTKKDDPKEGKEAPKKWTVAKETALRQGWCDVSENSISGNNMKAKGFWEAVIRYFKTETGSTRDVEMPLFYQTQGRKKSKTSKTTLRSASGGINLNEEADEVVQETQEFRPMADKFYNMKQKKKKEKKDKEQQSYIDLKNRELSIREAEAREIAQLKREKLEIQRQTLELAEREKRDRDILFYNSVIDPNFPPIQQQKVLEMKMKINARYNLDY
uniref:No apical meristem-associated C-terminal domain-containing protein n=1 Tax=Tanacetum cinerariifolium TaxID=118510 RepID=A0A6L2LVX4_TANCI|nr:hypothetical protein [Tanacetum cinerariifolium]